MIDYLRIKQQVVIYRSLDLVLQHAATQGAESKGSHKGALGNQGP